jgi:hypothetical protein
MRTVRCLAPPSPYEQELLRRVLHDGPHALEAATDLFESRQPATLAEAAGLVSAHGELTPNVFDCVTCAFDRYWHLHDMPCT